MSKSQIDLIYKSKKFLRSFNNKKFKPDFDSIFYLATYVNFIGSNILQSISDGNFKRNYSYFDIIKDIFYSLNFTDCKIISQNTTIKYDKIFLTWAFKNNFNKAGLINDRYFNINSNTVKNSLWFVIYLDKDLPNKIADNIVIFKTSNKKKFNFSKFISFFVGNVHFAFKDFRYFLASISNYNFFSNQFLNAIQPYIQKSVRQIFIPYEGQPFQNKLIAMIKKKKIKLKIIGYIHSPPLPMPTNFIFKKFSPDNIIVNGKDQILCFTKFLGWKKSKIKFLPSFRFLKSKKSFKKMIFLPANVNNPPIVLRSLKYLNDQKYINLKNYQVKNHPIAFKSKRNLKTVRLIESLKTKIQSNYKQNNFLIFIGNSGGIIEALERGAKVIQISEFSLFDAYSSEIWPSIIFEKINENIFFYKLKKKGQLIKLGNKNNILSNL